MTVSPDTNLEKDIEASHVTVIKFYSRWDQKSRMLEEPFSEIALDLRSRAHFIESEINANGYLARKFGVIKIPCIFFFLHGKKIGKIEEIPPKRILREEIEKVVARAQAL